MRTRNFLNETRLLHPGGEIHAHNREKNFESEELNRQTDKDKTMGNNASCLNINRGVTVIIMPPFPTQAQVTTFIYDHDKGQLDADFINYANDDYKKIYDQNNGKRFMSVREIYNLMREKFARLNAA